MLTAPRSQVAPGSYQELAAILRDASPSCRSIRPLGGGTKAGWGAPAPEPDLIVSTGRLAGVVEHNPEDLTAVVQAGTRLGDLQEILAARGQMLALDPPDGAPGSGGATIGGIVAAADSGPLRHRYGGVRDLVLGITVALSDGTVARAGGKVIKNVAGYDLAKLFTGSFGTLGVILEVALRLHPLPRGPRTVTGYADQPGAIRQAVGSLARAPLWLESLDVAWDPAARPRGTVLARVAGTGVAQRCEQARHLMADAGLDAREATEAGADAGLWASQRAGQRCLGGAMVRVSGLPSRLADVLGAVERLGAGARLVGRGGLGLSWIHLEATDTELLAASILGLRTRLAPMPCVVLDAPEELRRRVAVWGPVDPGQAALSRRVRERFDPPGVLNPGVL